MSKSAEFLRALAQNDYMINQHYLSTGESLYAIAAEIEHLRAAVRTMASCISLVAFEVERKGDLERARNYQDTAAFGANALMDDPGLLS